MCLMRYMRCISTHAPLFKGILEDAVGCIKELLLDGKRVQLDNLVSFGPGISQ